MTVEITPITEQSDLQGLRGTWRELAEIEERGALFRGPEWVLPWWDAYHRVLSARLHVLACHAGGKLVCLAPFYERVGRGVPGVKVREIRLLGDAGPRPPALDLLVAPGYEDSAGTAVAKYMAARASEWDVMDLEPLRDPSRARAAMITWLGNSGHQVRSKEAAGGARRIALAVAGIDVEKETAPDALASAYVDDPHALRKGLSALKRLSRLEWADREERSPLADREAAQLLENVTLELGSQHRARLARLDDPDGEAIAAALVVDDAERAVVLAMAVDPDHVGRQAPVRLLLAECRAAAARQCIALDVVTGAYEYDLPEFPMTRQRALGVRVYTSSGAAAVARTYGAVRKRVEAARDAPGTAAAGARAAWVKIRTAAANMARYERLHLYRGELWTRGIEPTSGLSLALFSLAEFDALGEAERAAMIESLDLDEQYCRQKWQRGDIVVLARLYDSPAGISWCARKSVSVPELSRTLRLNRHEAYIHDVFVAPEARGRAVAPSMLEFLAHELRQRDVYRAWALIGNDNVASVRAFEKAAYTAVADVIHAHFGSVERLIVRPPDPEARKLLGLA
ncbi:MAG: GNAT family N-acetyltransferase [Proteobacteria bacterium]|nr:GNAT family N-acetyltransferase [Pseudomonadota bacterium]